MDPKSLHIFGLQRALSGSVVGGGGTRRQIKSSLVTIWHSNNGSGRGGGTAVSGEPGKLVMQQSGDVRMANEARGSGDTLQRKLRPRVDIISKSQRCNRRTI